LWAGTLGSDQHEELGSCTPSVERVVGHETLPFHSIDYVMFT